MINHDVTYKKLLNNVRWLKLRKQVLSAHPVCQRCEAEGRLSPATEVHHIRPIEEAISKAEMERRAYDPTNVRALCHQCHLQTHIELGRSGKEATKRRNAKQVQEVIERFY